MVVFPTPEGPTIAVTWPAGMVSEAFEQHLVTIGKRDILESYDDSGSGALVPVVASSGGLGLLNGLLQRPERASNPVNS